MSSCYNAFFQIREGRRPGSRKTKTPLPNYSYRKIPHHRTHKSHTVPLLWFHPSSMHTFKIRLLTFQHSLSKTRERDEENVVGIKQLRFRVHCRLTSHTSKLSPVVIAGSTVTGALLSKSKWDIPFARNTSAVKRSYSKGGGGINAKPLRLDRDTASEGTGQRSVSKSA